MGVPKFSTFIISLVWISFFAVIFTGFISNLAINYGVDNTNLDFDSYNKLQELDTTTKELKEGVESFETKTGILDIIGAYFENGYRTAKTALKSIDVFFSMTNDALDDPSINIPAIQYLKTSIIITITIFLVIGVLLSAILKKDV